MEYVNLILGVGCLISVIAGGVIVYHHYKSRD